MHQNNYRNYGIYLPNNLRKGCFGILAKDNVDENAKCNLVRSHFHGTSLSILQPMEKEDEEELLGSLKINDTTRPKTLN